MKIFAQILVLFGFTFLAAVFGQSNEIAVDGFDVSKVNGSAPTRYHALELYNNDHPNQKRVAVRKCNTFNFIFPLKIFSTVVPRFCPAVFISGDSLLTSALCLRMLQQDGGDQRTDHLFAIVDREEVFFYEHGRRYVNNIFIHPKFDEEPAYYNVAIVKLRNAVYDRDATGRSHIACLWPEHNLKNPQTVLGEWFDFQPELNPSFRWLDLPTITHEQCTTELKNLKQPIPELSDGVRESSQICVQDPGSNSTLIRFCDSRSSGPLLMSLGTTVYVAGLPTVHIDDCGVQVEVFNRISFFLDWIESVVWPGQV
ncbi:serine protease Hayan-like isoform X2 [Uranotaenia lowii]|uniref:serine protease Hayan-like isoform X2 n=1 Tax=Uranotaenia lowii TaxID=190385 RepID=UPI0024785399|nr:serine protease Hayan-like isoform X2 [Uranotaenia lowii]